MKVVERLSLKEALSTRKPHLPGDPGSQPGGKGQVPQRDDCHQQLQRCRCQGQEGSQCQENQQDQGQDFRGSRYQEVKKARREAWPGTFLQGERGLLQGRGRGSQQPREQEGRQGRGSSWSQVNCHISAAQRTLLTLSI